MQCCVPLTCNSPSLVVRYSHVFCTSCIDEWVHGRSASRSCPCCKASMATAMNDDFMPLKTASPLGWRVLSRVRVCCPLKAQGCCWTGDYSELQSHLVDVEEHRGLSSTNAQSDPSEAAAANVASAAAMPSTSAGGGNATDVSRSHSAEANALALKDQAKLKYEARLFEDAVRLYSKAISVAPHLPILWTNRAAAHLMMRYPPPHPPPSTSAGGDPLMSAAGSPCPDGDTHYKQTGLGTLWWSIAMLRWLVMKLV